MANGRTKVAQCRIENASEAKLVRKGLLQDEEAKMSTKPIQLEGGSGHRLEGGALPRAGAPTVQPRTTAPSPAPRPPRVELKAAPS